MLVGDRLKDGQAGTNTYANDNKAKRKTPQEFVPVDKLCAVHTFFTLVNCRRAFLRSVLVISLDELYDGP
jgi:hypothetical protein